MLRSVITVSLAHLACATIASAAFLGVTIREDESLTQEARLALADAGVAGAETAVVLRVYAAFDGPGDGQTNTVLSTGFVYIGILPQTVRFYQDSFGTALPPGEQFIDLVPSLEFDTFGTIGGPTAETAPGAALGLGAFVSTSRFNADIFNSNPPNHAGAASFNLGEGAFGTLLFQFTLIDACGDMQSEAGGVVITDVLQGSFSVFTAGTGQAIENPVKLSLSGNQVDIASGPGEEPCEVNGRDLAQLLAWWGEADVCSSRGDFNFDDVINGADLAIMLASWGGGC